MAVGKLPALIPSLPFLKVKPAGINAVMSAVLIIGTAINPSKD